MASRNPVLALENRGTHSRIHVWGIPLDIVDPETLEPLLSSHLSGTGSSRIVFLRFHDLMRARRNPELKACLQDAALVIPVSRSIQTAMARLGFPPVHRYAPFDFMVKLLSVLDDRKGGYYLLGGSPQELAMVEKNLKSTCPHSQSLGRYRGSFSKTMEKNILTAIGKASPQLLITGGGLKGRDLWLYRRRAFFPRGIQVWSAECFDYFGLKKKRPLRSTFRHGHDFYHEISMNPLLLRHGFAWLALRFHVLMTRVFHPRRIARA